MSIQESLFKINDYLISINKDYLNENDQYYIDMGIPIKWEYKSTAKISCSETSVTEGVGKVLRITPLDPKSNIDDLVSFAEKIIDVNEKIESMEEEINKKIQKAKEEIEKEATSIAKKIDEMKKTTFSDENWDKDDSNDQKNKKGRKSLPKENTQPIEITETVTENN